MAESPIRGPLPRARAGRRVCAFAAAWLLLSTLCTGCGGVRVHGPILQWHADPTTTMTVIWVERTASDATTDAVWQAGLGGFGYGADGIRTELADMRGRYNTVAIRRTVDLAALPGHGSLIVRAMYDDGFIMWVNGAEVLRTNVETGSGPQARGISAINPDRPADFPIENWTALRRTDAPTVIAFEGHNVALDSSDFLLNVSLVWTDGAEERLVLADDAPWEFFTGGHPPEGWQARVAGLRLTDVVHAHQRLTQRRGTVRFREVGTSRWSHVNVENRPFGDTGSVVRRAQLIGLEPDTEYEFMIPDAGSGDARGRGGRFRTAPAVYDRPMRFVTGGDMYHQRDWLDSMNRRAGLQDPLFALIGGDLAYADGRNPQRWHVWLDSWYTHARTEDGRLIPMIVAIGNHEMGSRLTAEQADVLGVHPNSKFYYSLFVLPLGSTHSVVDFGQHLSVICLDSNHAQSVRGQTDFLRGTLEERDDRQFVFVCYHAPAFGTGVKDDIMPIRNQWAPLFEKHSVTAVFENDHHIYKRTTPIRESRVDHERGVPYLGDGAWGVGVRQIPDYSDKPYIVHAESVRHLIRVDLEGNRRTYTALRADGRVIDQWVDERPLRGE